MALAACPRMNEGDHADCKVATRSKQHEGTGKMLKCLRWVLDMSKYDASYYYLVFLMLIFSILW